MKTTLTRRQLLKLLTAAGHAAGAATALAVEDKCPPRDVNIPQLQKLLVKQGAYLG